jgi:Flp pilus assembly protein TadD
LATLQRKGNLLRAISDLAMSGRMTRPALKSPIAFDEAIVAYEAGQREQLLPALQASVAANTADARLWHLNGLVLRELGRREEALPALRKAAQLAPGSAKIAHALARTLLEAGLPSIDAFGRALRLAPGETDIVSGLTAAFVADGDPGTAIAGLEKILSRSPHWAGGHALLAKLRWAQGEREGFDRGFEAAVTAMPQNLDVWREWIIALIHAEYFESALRVIAMARSAIGDQPLLAANEAIVAAETGDFDRAELLFAPFADLDDATVQVRRVRHYLRAARPEEADRIIAQWTGRPDAFLFWPYASVAWRMMGDPRWEWLEGDDRFVGVWDIADRLPPLDKLAGTLRKLHTLSGQPLEQSLRGGSQTDGNLFTHIDPMLVDLREAIRTTVADHVARFPPVDENHPLLGRPRAPIEFSGAWSVRLQAGGYHANHVHPAGWISSALYIALPPDLGKEDAGFLTLGDPKTPTLDIEMPPFRTIEPKPGRLVLFPSYMWHGTRPFAEGERITVAFDVAVPAVR